MKRRILFSLAVCMIGVFSSATARAETIELKFGHDTVNLGIGQQTPPVASVLMTACSIAKSDIWETTKVNVYFIGVLLLALILVTYLPAIPMSLVH